MIRMMKEDEDDDNDNDGNEDKIMRTVKVMRMTLMIQQEIRKRFVALPPPYFSLKISWRKKTIEDKDTLYKIRYK